MLSQLVLFTFVIDSNQPDALHQASQHPQSSSSPPASGPQHVHDQLGQSATPDHAATASGKPDYSQMVAASQAVSAASSSRPPSASRLHQNPSPEASPVRQQDPNDVSPTVSAPSAAYQAPSQAAPLFMHTRPDANGAPQPLPSPPQPLLSSLQPRPSSVYLPPVTKPGLPGASHVRPLAEMPLAAAAPEGVSEAPGVIRLQDGRSLQALVAGMHALSCSPVVPGNSLPSRGACKFT